MLAWRDLADPEAGGSEVHADKVAEAWAGAGLDVTMRTAAASVSGTSNSRRFSVGATGRGSALGNASAGEV